MSTERLAWTRDAHGTYRVEVVGLHFAIFRNRVGLGWTLTENQEHVARFPLLVNAKREAFCRARNKARGDK